LKEYKGYMLFFFQNGKVAKIDMNAYETKQNRKKLIKAYSDKSPLVSAVYVQEDKEFVIRSSAGRYLLFHSGAISPKTTKDSQGVGVMTLKKGHRVEEVTEYIEGRFSKAARYRTKNLPGAGAILSAEDQGEQLKI
ncbi:MAG: topoisomerase IV, partial [Oscillospiraceae bacterium]|nr:topoisomerase IV [Oscillospiraceae bacterium]